MKYKCPKCGREYEDSERGHFPGKPCRYCTEIWAKLGKYQRELLAQNFSLEQKDVQIARQINELLVRESTGISENDESLLNQLTEQLLKDEERRIKIVEEIRKLQKKKK